MRSSRCVDSSPLLSADFWSALEAAYAAGCTSAMPSVVWQNFELPSLIAVFGFSPVASQRPISSCFCGLDTMTDASVPDFDGCGSSGADQRIRPAFLLSTCSSVLPSAWCSRGQKFSPGSEFKRISTSNRSACTALSAPPSQRQLLPSHSSKPSGLNSADGKPLSSRADRWGSGIQTGRRWPGSDLRDGMALTGACPGPLSLSSAMESPS